MKILIKILPAVLIALSCNNNDAKSKRLITLETLAFPNDSVSAQPHLFTDENGTVYLSRIKRNQDTAVLQYFTLRDGKWSNPSTIIHGTNWFVNWADYPMITSDGAGNMLAHFLEKSEKGKYTYDVKFVTSDDNGVNWSDPKILNEDGKKAEHGFVSMMPQGDDYFVSWLDGRNAAEMDGGTHGHQDHAGEMTLRAATISKKGIKSAEWELDKRVCDCCQTTASLTANGPVVIYRDRSIEEIRDIYIVRLVNGKWTEPKPVYNDNWKISGCPVNGPRSDARGNNLAIAWFSLVDTIGQVKVIFSEDGGATFGTPVRIDDRSALGRVDIIMIDDRSAIVSWMEGSEIKWRRVNADGKTDPSVLVSSSSESRSSGFPQMTLAGNKIIFAWSDAKEKNIKTASFTLEQ